MRTSLIFQLVHDTRQLQLRVKEHVHTISCQLCAFSPLIHDTWLETSTHAHPFLLYALILALPSTPSLGCEYCHGHLGREVAAGLLRRAEHQLLHLFFEHLVPLLEPLILNEKMMILVAGAGLRCFALVE